MTDILKSLPVAQRMREASIDPRSKRVTDTLVLGEGLGIRARFLGEYSGFGNTEDMSSFFKAMDPALNTIKNEALKKRTANTLALARVVYLGLTRPESLGAKADVFSMQAREFNAVDLRKIESNPDAFYLALAYMFRETIPTDKGRTEKMPWAFSNDSIKPLTEPHQKLIVAAAKKAGFEPSDADGYKCVECLQDIVDQVSKKLMAKKPGEAIFTAIGRPTKPTQEAPKQKLDDDFWKPLPPRAEPKAFNPFKTQPTNTGSQSRSLLSRLGRMKSNELPENLRRKK